MTRALAHALNVPRSQMHHQLQLLERAAGHPKIDIRLTTELIHAGHRTLRQLGLDANDTTAEELYHSLLARVSSDDTRLEKQLRYRAAQHVNAEANVTDGIAHVLQEDASRVSGFGIKPTVLRRLLKKQPPKKLQKALRYRSFDAMLRHESPAALALGAAEVESAAWLRQWHDAYRALTAVDFEARTAAIVRLDSDRWQPVVQKIIARHYETILTLPEASTIAILPLPKSRPSGAVIATVALGVQACNDLRAAASYLRAVQVQPDFGDRVRSLVRDDVQVEAPRVAEPIAWRVVHEYYARLQQALNEDIFGPSMKAADFSWQSIEKRLAELCEPLAFWESTNHMVLKPGQQAISCNIIDAAINACNNAGFAIRRQEQAQAALRQELTMRYIHHDSLEQAVGSLLQPQLTAQTET